MVITMALVLETHYNLVSLNSGRKEKNNSESILSMVILKEPLLMWGANDLHPEQPVIGYFCWIGVWSGRAEQRQENVPGSSPRGGQLAVWQPTTLSRCSISSRESVIPMVNHNRKKERDSGPRRSTPR